MARNTGNPPGTVARRPRAQFLLRSRGAAQTGISAVAIQAPAEEHNEDSFFPIAGIQPSAGGPVAYTELLSHLSDEPRITFVLVQHTDPKREAALAPFPQSDWCDSSRNRNAGTRS